MPWFYIIVFVSVIFGALIWQVGWVIALGLMTILLYHSWHLHQLKYWLQSNDSTVELPESQGIWGRVFDGIMQLQKQHQCAQKELKNTIIRVQKSATALREGVVTVDAHGALSWWNTAARKMLGLNKKQDLGAPLINLLREPNFFRYYKRGDFTHPITVHAPVNPEQVLQIAVTEFGKGENLLVVRDITEHHKLESMRRDFVANASHELRTPLTVVHGYLEILQLHNSNLDAQVRKAHRRMLVQTQRMSDMVQNLLILSRLEANLGDIEANYINMSLLCKQARRDARTLMQQAGKKVNINVHIESERHLLGTETEIRSALNNLVANAVKYTPDGGQIDIYWRDTHDGLCFAVTDNGIGVAHKHLQRLTERFYRVDSSRCSDSGGTGLGLAIVKHVMVHHKGALEITSQEGQCSCFTCTFPNTSQSV